MVFNRTEDRDNDYGDLTMAIYRNIQMSFWTDSKILDDFTSNMKLMYLYLLTNPHTNLCGCYELSKRQMSFEIGFDMATTKDTFKELIDIGCVKYDEDTREVLVTNWHRYNWTSSEKFRKPLLAEINNIKASEFQTYLLEVYERYGIDTSGYGIDTTVTVTDTVTVSVTDTDTVSDKKETRKKKQSEPKEKYGEYGNVKLTDKEYERLIEEFGEDGKEAIEYLDMYIQEKHKRYDSCYLAIRRWVIDAVRERNERRQKTSVKSSKKSYSELAVEMMRNGEL